MNISFLLNTKAEVLKTKRTPALWITFIGAAFVPIAISISDALNPKQFGPLLKPNAWGVHLSDCLKVSTGLFFPIYVILIIGLLVQIETRNNAWKQVYVLPRRYADIIFSKFLVAQFFIISFLIILFSFIIISGYGLMLFRKDFGFSASGVPLERALLSFANIYASVLPISIIQYWLSLRTKSFITPLGIGLGIFFIGSTMLGVKEVIYIPYVYSTIMQFGNFTKDNNFLYTAKIYSLIFFLLGTVILMTDIYKKKEKG